MPDNQRPSSKGAHLVPYQFQPGVSGNPKGRPKGRISLVGILDDVLNNLEHPSFPNKKLARALVEKTIYDAFQNDGQSRRLVWEYMEGKPNMMSDFFDHEDDPVVIVDDL